MSRLRIVITGVVLVFCFALFYSAVLCGTSIGSFQNFIKGVHSFGWISWSLVLPALLSFVLGGENIEGKSVLSPRQQSKGYSEWLFEIPLKTNLSDIHFTLNSNSQFSATGPMFVCLKTSEEKSK